MNYEKYVKTYKITSYHELLNIIQGKNNHIDLREKFIFRGLNNESYKLIPSSLRRDKNNQCKINKFISEDFKLNVNITLKESIEKKWLSSENLEKFKETQKFPISINKYNQPISQGNYDVVHSYDEILFRKEITALMNFLDYADKTGLKIPIKQNIRELIQHDIDKEFQGTSYWPTPDFFELISLAQHYGIPTRALDWTYDYKVALYFVVKNILKDNYENNEKPRNGILWAFNFKHFQEPRIFYYSNIEFQFQYYRPEYNSNPNLNAQKGLFTFIIDETEKVTKLPFDEFIVKSFEDENSHFYGLGQKLIYLPENEKVFYKFIIPEELKPKILNELYKEGYSEEYLFPGYSGVVKSIKNRVKLEKLLSSFK